MKKQGRQAETFCASPDGHTPAALIFGKPGAPIEEFGETLVSNWQKLAPEPLDIRRVSFEDVRQDPESLVDGLYSSSLFGGATLFIATITKDSEAAPFLTAVSEIETRDSLPAGRMLLMAGDLTTRSKLRKAFEAAKRATSLQLFERTQREFENWIKDRLDKDKVSLDAEAFQTLVYLLNDDQSLAPSELQKVALFAADRNEPITKKDITSLIALEDQSSHFEMIDLALDGKVVRLGELLPKLALESVSIPVLIGLINQLKRLLRAHEIAAEGISGPKIGERLTPRIFERQWPAFESRMRTWHTPRIIALLSRIHDVDVACRRASSPQEAIVGQLLLDIARAGAASRR